MSELDAVIRSVSHDFEPVHLSCMSFPPQAIHLLLSCEDSCLDPNIASLTTRFEDELPLFEYAIRIPGFMAYR